MIHTAIVVAGLSPFQKFASARVRRRSRPRRPALRAPKESTCTSKTWRLGARGVHHQGAGFHWEIYQTLGILNGGFHKWRYPKIDGLQWSILLKGMIWGYPYCRTFPNWGSEKASHLGGIPKSKSVTLLESQGTSRTTRNQPGSHTETF